MNLRRNLGVPAFALALSLAFAGNALAVTPTPVLLGTAGGFAILAGSGMTNTGVTTITGDVGSSPTRAETGFAACPAADCVVLTGANHNDPDPNDAATVDAKLKLITAYENARGQLPTLILSDLGSHTYTEGVYNTADGQLGITAGALTLDGANNADSIFIFQTQDGGGTLITAASTSINFIRGAQACNVFWKVGSSATLGASSTFRGTILAKNSISLGDAVTVDGRLLAGESNGAGAVTLIHDTITKPAVCLSQVAIDAAAAAAAAAQAAANAAAAATAAANQAAADAAAAAVVAAAKAADDAKIAAAAAAKAAADAATAAAAAKKAAAAANLKAAKAAAAKAVLAAKVAAAKTAKAKAAAATARAIARQNLARPARRHVGLTG